MKTLGQVMPEWMRHGCRLSPDTPIEDICCDSRQVRPGSLFVAVDGEREDGHRFLAEAVKNGAAAVVVSRPEAAQGLPYIAVEDSRRALSALADAWYDHPSRRLSVIGVTGTNGKTTVSHMLHAILSAAGWRCGLIGTNRIVVGERESAAHQTTPDALETQRLLWQMVGAGCRAAVMEVSSHALCHHRVDDVAFEQAIFTNLTQDHLDFHGDMEHYAAAKARLFTMARRGIGNGDDAFFAVMQRAAAGPMLRFSIGDDTADLTARDVRVLPHGVDFLALSRGELVRAHVPIPGRFSVYNALAALLSAQQLGLSLEQAAQALSSMDGVRGRAEIVPVPREFTVMIDYAHTPDGMERMLSAVRETCRGRLIAVFGCGGDRDRGKRPKMGAAAARWADLSIVTSDNPRSEEPMDIIQEILPGLGQAEYEVVPERPQAIARALSLGQPGDVIILLGKGHETDQQIGNQRLPLDERDVIRRYFAGEN